MAKQTLITIKNWFKTSLKPTQQQFWDTWDSFWHKDDKIPTSSIENLDVRFDEKADAELLNAHFGDLQAHGINNKVDKEAGKGLSSNDYTTAEKEKLSGIQEAATANEEDDYLLNRANHTGVQEISTVNGLESALATKADLVDGKVPTAQLPEATALSLQQVLDAGNIAINTPSYSQIRMDLSFKEIYFGLFDDETGGNDVSGIFVHGAYQTSIETKVYGDESYFVTQPNLIGLNASNSSGMGSSLTLTAESALAYNEDYSERFKYLSIPHVGWVLSNNIMPDDVNVPIVLQSTSFLRKNSPYATFFFYKNGTSTPVGDENGYRGVDNSNVEIDLTGVTSLYVKGIPDEGISYLTVALYTLNSSGTNVGGGLTLISDGNRVGDLIQEVPRLQTIKDSGFLQIISYAV